MWSPWLAGHLVGSQASGLSCTSLLCLDMAQWASQLLRGDAGLSLKLVSAQGCSLIGFLLCLSKAFLFLFFVLLPGRFLYIFRNRIVCFFVGFEMVARFCDHLKAYKKTNNSIPENIQKTKKNTNTYPATKQKNKNKKAFDKQRRKPMREQPCADTSFSESPASPRRS